MAKLSLIRFSRQNNIVGAHRHWTKPEIQVRTTTTNQQPTMETHHILICDKVVGWNVFWVPQGEKLT